MITLSSPSSTDGYYITKVFRNSIKCLYFTFSQITVKEVAVCWRKGKERNPQKFCRSRREIFKAQKESTHLEADSSWVLSNKTKSSILNIWLAFLELISSAEFLFSAIKLGGRNPLWIVWQGDFSWSVSSRAQITYTLVFARFQGFYTLFTKKLLKQKLLFPVRCIQNLAISFY